MTVIIDMEGKPMTWWMVAVAGLAALGWGAVLRARLNRLTYRNADETSRPSPGHRWWLLPVTPAAAVAVAALACRPGWGWITVVPLALAGPWLAAVDLDVCRIPNRVLTPVAALTMVALIALAALRSSPGVVATGLIGGLVAGGVFAAIHFLTRGGIGFGDVKLAAVIGLALAAHGLSTVWVALLAGSIIGAAWGLINAQKGGFAYGPWLLSGAWLAAIIGALT